MSGLIRAVNFVEQPVVLTAQKCAAAQPQALSDHAGAPHPAVEPPPAEPVLERFTYAEFIRRFEPELLEARERALAEGYAEGHETGVAEGRAQGAAEYQTKLAHLAELLAGARNAMEREIEGMDDIGVEIVYEAVAKIIGAHMSDRNAVISTVREVMQKAKERSRLVARVAPHDYELVNGDCARLIEGLNVGEVDIVPDDRVQMSGCLLETPTGNLDGRLEIQLGQLRDALLRARTRQG